MGPWHSRPIYLGRRSYPHSLEPRVSRSAPDGPPCRLNADRRCPQAIATGIAELHRRQRPRSYYMSSSNPSLEGAQARIRQTTVAEPPTFLDCSSPLQSTQNLPRNPRGDQYQQGSRCFVQSQANERPQVTTKVEPGVRSSQVLTTR